MKDETSLPAEAAARLRAYGALDHPIRLRAYVRIQRSAGLAFRDLAEAEAIESGLMAYHLGVLKAAGLVDVHYERSGMETSHYRLSPLGLRIFDELFAGRPPGLRRGGSRKAIARAVPRAKT